MSVLFALWPARTEDRMWFAWPTMFVELALSAIFNDLEFLSLTRTTEREADGDPV